MPEQETFKPATNIDEAWAAVDAFPLEPGDPRYMDFKNMRGNTGLKLIKMLQRHQMSKRNLHLLFTGYRGNGKTTEIYQFQSKISQDYEVIYFDANKELDVNSLSITDIMLAIAKETVDFMKSKSYKMNEKVLEDVADWFYERVVEKTKIKTKDAQTKAKLGTPKWISFITGSLLASMKMSTENREIVRRTLENNVSELIQRINKLIKAAQDEIHAKGKKDLVFIMDSLDRIEVEQAKKIFFSGGTLLQQMKGHFIYVIPISLLYDTEAILLPFDEKIVLPMIPVCKRGIDRNEDTEKIAKLFELIRRRIDLDKVFSNPDSIIKSFIMTSGGHLRDLMKLISYATNETFDIIEDQHAKIAINTLTKDYERIVHDEEYSHLVATYNTQNPPNDVLNQRLIYNNAILVYEDTDSVGEEWKDVHPALQRNEKFQKAYALSQ